jgi:hypothetical protein
MASKEAPVVKLGQPICALWEKGWKLAIVVATNAGSYDVVYANGGTATVPRKSVKVLFAEPYLEKGDAVLALGEDGVLFLPGKVVAVDEMSFQVQWDDGRKPVWVPAGRILRK